MASTATFGRQPATEEQFDPTDYGDHKPIEGSVKRIKLAPVPYEPAPVDARDPVPSEAELEALIE